jgi:hypothetical protein
MDEQGRQAIEQELRTRINQMVDEALAEAEQDKPLSMSDIEEIALAVRAKVGQEVAQTLVREQAAVSVPGPLCAKCGREMHDKGMKKRRLVSRSGEVEWERP